MLARGWVGGERGAEVRVDEEGWSGVDVGG
jgi:hypothetical protein